MQNTFFASALVVLPFSLSAAISLFWSQTSPYFLVVIASIRTGLRPCLVLHTVNSLCTLSKFASAGLCERPITAWQIPSVSPGELEPLPELRALTQILSVPLLVLVCILSIIMSGLSDIHQFNSGFHSEESIGTLVPRGSHGCSIFLWVKASPVAGSQEPFRVMILRKNFPVIID